MPSSISGPTPCSARVVAKKSANVRGEAVTPPEIVDKLLKAAGRRGLVLVGGQALHFWMTYYGIELPPNIPAISRDVDFLAESAANVDDVYWLASVLGGRALIPHERALTALVGQAQKDAGPDEVINVDVIFKVFGAREGLRDRAVLAEVDGHAFKVMHQLDLLKSRLDNLYLLAEKQTPNGVMQLDRAVLVARAFLADVAKQPAQDAMRPPVLMYIKLVEHLALSDAGRKVAERFGVHVADAIDPQWVHHTQFHVQKLPQLRTLMSPAWAIRCGDVEGSVPG